AEMLRPAGAALPAEREVLGVRYPAERRGEAVREVEHRCDLRDVEDVLVAPAGRAQLLDLGLAAVLEVGRELDGEVEHRALARLEVGDAVIGRDPLDED